MFRTLRGRLVAHTSCTSLTDIAIHRPSRSRTFPSEARLNRTRQGQPRPPDDRRDRRSASRNGLGAATKGERGAASRARSQLLLLFYFAPIQQIFQASVARRTALATEISSTLKPFYCALCEKQFQNVAQYDEHTNSYAHHHKARLRDTNANQRAMVAKEDPDKRRENERKREEKELRKIAKAQGIKISK